MYKILKVLCLHILTYIVKVEILDLFLNFTKKIWIGSGFYSMLQTHVIIGFSERCTFVYLNTDLKHYRS